MLALAVAAASLACRRPSGAGPAAATVPTPAPARVPLTAADLQMFLAVRAKALARLEEELDRAEAGGGVGLAQVADLAVAEQDAAAALGFEWGRYRWVREEVARVLAEQRERTDAELLALELSRARDDLRAQIPAARDPASRQFLEAQVAALEGQLARLAGSRTPPPSEAKSLESISAVRAEIAVQQGRQERIARRLRELLQRERAGTAPATLRTPSAPRG